MGGSIVTNQTTWYTTLIKETIGNMILSINAEQADNV